ncbi:hypothetical protein RRG08_007064 [Elysia crispata]|uniref:Uncharacterized protein n=1 Tax=Elysia crispata TaxID=231223 RepID=A0AAE0XUQ6_9GAST|nr:hypothetical protein RRG08_007064 [Elysia crispata]
MLGGNETLALALNDTTAVITGYHRLSLAITDYQMEIVTARQASLRNMMIDYSNADKRKRFSFCSGSKVDIGQGEINTSTRHTENSIEFYCGDQYRRQVNEKLTSARHTEKICQIALVLLVVTNTGDRQVKEKLTFSTTHRNIALVFTVVTNTGDRSSEKLTSARHTETYSVKEKLTSARHTENSVSFTVVTNTGDKVKEKLTSARHTAENSVSFTVVTNTWRQVKEKLTSARHIENSVSFTVMTNTAETGQGEISISTTHRK